MEPLLWDNLPGLALDLNGAGTHTKFSNQTLARIGSPWAAVKHNPMDMQSQHVSANTA
jgi:hypothetical protein